MRSKGSKRATVDTTIIVSAFIRRGLPHEVVRLWQEEAFALVVSTDIMGEYQEVLNRPNILTKYQLDPAEVQAFLEDINTNAEFVVPLAAEHFALHSRDPKDDIFLACALAGQCDYLVTGDRDLLDLQGHLGLGQLRIVTPREFLEAVKESELG